MWWVQGERTAALGVRGPGGVWRPHGGFAEKGVWALDDAEAFGAGGHAELRFRCTEGCGKGTTRPRLHGHGWTGLGIRGRDRLCGMTTNPYHRPPPMLKTTGILLLLQGCSSTLCWESLTSRLFYEKRLTEC